MQEGFSSRYADAMAKREALERERETADPDRRAAIDMQIVSARDQEHAARMQLDEANGFSGVPQIEQTQAQHTQEQQATQKQEPQTVSQKEYRSGARFPGALGYFQAERMTETHLHPDIAEAKLANARTQQIREQLAEERAAQEDANQREAESAAKDRERAERVFDGGRTQEGFGTQDYLAIERTHQQATLDYAQHADAMEATEAAEMEILADLTEATGVEHIVMEPDTAIEGEIMQQVEVKGAAYYAVEFSDERGQTMRALIPAEGQHYAVGDVIEVERRLGYHIDSSYDYGR